MFDDPGDPYDPGAAWSVSIFYYNATDAGLEHLKELLENLKEPIKIESLLVDSSGMRWGTKPDLSDAGLEHLRGLTYLECLNLASTNVTDEGLEHLKGLTNLETLSLDNAKVTDAGVKKLQQALPNCTIHR